MSSWDDHLDHATPIMRKDLRKLGPVVSRIGSANQEFVTMATAVQALCSTRLLSMHQQAVTGSQHKPSRFNTTRPGGPSHAAADCHRRSRLCSGIEDRWVHPAGCRFRSALGYRCLRRSPVEKPRSPWLAHLAGLICCICCWQGNLLLGMRLRPSCSISELGSGLRMSRLSLRAGVGRNKINICLQNHDHL